MRFLMKFGGTSVADSQCIQRVVDILEKHHTAETNSPLSYRPSGA